MLVMGVDLGTSGARALITDGSGVVVAAGRGKLPPTPVHPLGWREQVAQDWWRAVRGAIRRAVAGLEQSGHRAGQIRAVGVTSTSGTVLLVDRMGRPLTAALLYNDPRSAQEAAEVDQAGLALWTELGYRMNASFALPKALWLKRHRRSQWEAARHLVHAADFLAGRLTDQWGMTDFSTALKTGYDLIRLRWPAEILRTLDLDEELLPRVLSPGEPLGHVTLGASLQTGLPEGIPVVGAMTDGCASQLAAGAVAPGQWSTTIGSTLVVKGVTRELLQDPLGVVYCHRHPQGWWMPGGAGNTGGAVLADRFGRSRLAGLARRASFPSNLLCYPLPGKGERFPFASREAEGFLLGRPQSPSEEYAACLEGIGYVERYAYEVLQRMGAEIEGPVSSAGGGAGSEVWLQVRADILGRPVIVPAVPEAAFGAAMLAAMHGSGLSLVETARAMVSIAAEYEPRPAMSARYAEQYAAFCRELKARGYVN